MPQQVMTSVDNNFTKGLITEATGLNFPENAATAANNCEFTLIGDVIRRQGINEELNGTTLSATRLNFAINEYVWNNPGGDSNSKLLVQQIGTNLYFFNIATSTVASPLSTQRLSTVINISLATAVGGVLDLTSECQFADGNGYLFVFHKSCDPFYLTYNPGTQVVAALPITVQIRDFVGVVDNLPVNVRPSSLSNDHEYNLLNQGWTLGSPWTGFSTTTYNLQTTGLFTFTIQTGLTVNTGDNVVIIYTGLPFFGGPNQNQQVASGTVNSYTSVSGLLTINITSAIGYQGAGSSFTIIPVTTGMLSTFHTAAGVWPSNSDVWWTFKDATDTFNPASTLSSVTATAGEAPSGHFIIGAFVGNKPNVSGLPVTDLTTTGRPSTGAWFAGRVWYTGLSAFQAAQGDENFYTWTENIYFSQIISGPKDFGTCYQVNDPTSQDLNGLLPTDGGVITIVGSGTIHKIFPISNGMLVFASNGVWFITGSQGIGFTADDYTITKISNIKTLSSKSFVDVLGLPLFWNEEGIYQVTAAQNGGSLVVEPLTVGTILSFYNEIPLASKKHAKGAYDPINYVVQWVFKSTQEASITDRYSYDSILNFNTYNKAFFPYSVDNTVNSMNGISYISYPYISTVTPLPGFKYPSSSPSGITYLNTFAEEYDTSYVDWGSINYTSSFTTGFKLHGKATSRFQVPYVYTFSRNEGYAAFYIQGVWNYAINTDSNKTSMSQFVEINETNTGMAVRRHRIRGRGTVLQLQFTSVPNQPFDLMGWALYDTVNVSV